MKWLVNHSLFDFGKLERTKICRWIVFWTTLIRCNYWSGRRGCRRPTRGDATRHAAAEHLPPIDEIFYGETIWTPAETLRSERNTSLWPCSTKLLSPCKDLNLGVGFRWTIDKIWCLKVIDSAKPNSQAVHSFCSPKRQLILHGGIRHLRSISFHRHLLYQWMVQNFEAYLVNDGFEFISALFRILDLGIHFHSLLPTFAASRCLAWLLATTMVSGGQQGEIE